MARSFNGSSDIITCGTGGGVGAGSAWSASALVYPTGGSGNQTIIAKRSGFSVGTNQFEFYIKVTGTIFGITKDATAIETSITYTANAWNRLTATCDASNAIFYNNTTNHTPVGNAASGSATNQNLDIGGLSFASAQFFTGNIADVAIWNVKLTAAEAAILRAGYSPLFVRPVNLVHYWPIIGRASVEMDIVDGRSGTLTGTANFDSPRIIMPRKTKIRRMNYSGQDLTQFKILGLASAEY